MSGNTAVPLPPAATPERLAFLIKDSGATVVLATKELVSISFFHQGLRIRGFITNNDLVGRGSSGSGKDQIGTHLLYCEKNMSEIWLSPARYGALHIYLCLNLKNK
jgi:hypothetical protein